MSKRVLDVGNCRPDHAAIRQLIEGNFAATVIQADRRQDALAALRSDPFDLVLINRRLNRDYSDGIDVIRAIKDDEALAGVPVMLITNYAEHQQEAIHAGAEPGFGKLELSDPTTLGKLGQFLGHRRDTPPDV
jgi:CheY-like chemotaxis protein